MRCSFQITALIVALLAMLPAFGACTGESEAGPRSSESESPLSAPVLLSPANNSYVEEQNPLFRWMYPKTEENVSFHIQIDYGTRFDCLAVNASLSPGNHTFNSTNEIGGDWTYYWRVRAQDPAGAAGPWSESWCVHVDSCPPSVHFNGWPGYVTRRNISIGLCASDTGSGPSEMRYSLDRQNWSAWEPYSGTIYVALGDMDGRWNISVQVKDMMNHTSGTVTTSAILDRIAPIGTVMIDNGTDYVNRSIVRLALWANDTSGVTDMMVSNESDFHSADWRPFKSSLQWTLPPGDGWKTVYVKYRDRAKLESAVESALVLLDTISPATDFVINGGKGYVNSTSVLLALTANEPEPGSGIDGMAFSPDGLNWGPWEPFCTTSVYYLNPGDGPRSICLMTKDRAGNIGDVSVRKIILDTTPPHTTIPSFVNETPDVNFTVAWAATDELGGIRSFDVQYSQNGGPWTEWLTGVDQTRGIFHGTDGSSYLFRARAQDQAGNIGAFAQTGPEPLNVRVPRPLVSIQWPARSGVMYGEYTASGTASCAIYDRPIQRVEVCMDGGTWQTANGTLGWNFRLDTTALKDGPHSLGARSFDGTKYSDPVTVDISVRNQPGRVETKNDLPMQISIVLLSIIAVLVISYVAITKRSPKAPK
jgi:hypothetical protein